MHVGTKFLRLVRDARDGVGNGSPTEKGLVR